MGSEAGVGLTYDDLLRMPETNVFQELIDGELIVSPSPRAAHQLAVSYLVLELGLYTREHGGIVIPGPMDVLVDQRNVVQPDILVIRSDHVRPGLERPITEPPDLAIEVLSPSNRRHDLVRKRRIYERFGVPELWFVDLDAGTLTQLVLVGGAFADDVVRGAGTSVGSRSLPGFVLDLDRLLAATR